MFPEAAAAEESPTPLGDAPGEDDVVDAAASADCGVNAGLGIKTGYVQAIANAHCHHRHDIYVFSWLMILVPYNTYYKAHAQKVCRNALSCYVETPWVHNPAGNQCWSAGAGMYINGEHHKVPYTPCTYR
jgi:hypothetical protein